MKRPSPAIGILLPSSVTRLPGVGAAEGEAALGKMAVELDGGLRAADEAGAGHGAAAGP